MILDASINTVKFNEMAAAETQIASVRETIGDLPFMVTMDRGYPSTPAFLRLIDSGVYFVARLKSSDYKAEQQALSSDDEDVTIAMTKSRRNHYMGTADEAVVMSRDSFKLRMVRVWLDEDHTAYQTLKDRLQMENFTGTKPILLEQDIYSTIYVSNIAEDYALKYKTASKVTKSLR